MLREASLAVFVISMGDLELIQATYCLVDVLQKPRDKARENFRTFSWILECSAGGFMLYDYD